MTDDYIDSHFDEIREHASDIETRLEDSSVNKENLKADNHAYISGCQQNGEQITLIASNFEQTIKELLNVAMSQA